MTETIKVAYWKNTKTFFCRFCFDTFADGKIHSMCFGFDLPSILWLADDFERWCKKITLDKSYAFEFDLIFFFLSFLWYLSQNQRNKWRTAKNPITQDKLWNKILAISLSQFKKQPQPKVQFSIPAAPFSKNENRIGWQAFSKGFQLLHIWTNVKMMKILFD